MAKTFGYLHVDHLLDELTGTEMDEWYLYSLIEPWGYQADNHRAGVVTATLANYIGQLNTHNALKPTDIFPVQTFDTHQAPRASAIQHYIKQLVESGHGKT